MNGKFLLDTNIIIAILNKEEKALSSLSSTLDTFIPYVVVGELYYGAYNSVKVEFNLNTIDRLCEAANIIYADENTAKIYGAIKSNLKKAGNFIPENDIWIAACAKQNNLTLVTRDAHFKKVEGISIEEW